MSKKVATEKNLSDTPRNILQKLKDLRKRKKLLFAIGIIIVIVGFFVGRSFINGSKKPQYQTAKVEKGEIISTVSESGNVSSGEVDVSSPTNGIIEEMYVQNGDDVQAGQNLFKVRSTATAQEQAAAYAGYLSAVASEKTSEQSKLSADASMWSAQQAVLNAQNDVNYKNANTTNPATKQDYTDLEKQAIDAALTAAQKSFTAAETKYTQADYGVNAAKAQLSSSWLSYQETQSSVVTAPVAGTVANIAGGQGANVSASAGTASTTSSSSTGNTTSSTTTNNSSSSTPVLILANFSTLYIKAPVSEIDEPNVKASQKATITLDAFPDKTYVGTVSNIDTIGTSSSGVVTYNAYISLESPPAEIKPGMTASLTIQTNRKEDVLIVPTSAVQTANGASYVRVLKNGKVSQVAVTTGISSDSDTEIISGLSEGEDVVTSIVASTTQTTSTSTSPFSGFGGGGGRGFGGAGGGGARNVAR